MAGRRIPVEIATVRTPDGEEQRVPRVPLNDVLRARDLDVQRATEAVAARYWGTVDRGKQILKRIEHGRRESLRVDPRLYWELGDLLTSYIRNNDAGEVFLDRAKAHFCKDLGISDTSWRKIVRFRRLVPSPQLLDPSKDWRFYRDAPSRRVRDAVATVAARMRKSQSVETLSLQLPGSTVAFLDDLRRRVSAQSGRSVEPSSLVAALLAVVAAKAAGPSLSFSFGEIVSDLVARLADRGEEEDDALPSPAPGTRS